MTGSMDMLCDSCGTDHSDWNKVSVRPVAGAMCETWRCMRCGEKTEGYFR